MADKKEMTIAELIAMRAECAATIKWIDAKFAEVKIEVPSKEAGND